MMQRSSRRFVLLSIGILAAFVLVFLGRDVLSPGGGPVPVRDSASALAATLDDALGRSGVHELPGVAVFAPVAEAADADLLSLGDLLCEAITERLVETRRLRLVSCTSTRAATQANLAGSNLAHLLGIDYALEGQLRRDTSGAPLLTLRLNDLRNVAVLFTFEDKAVPERVPHVVSRVTERVLTGVVADAELEITPIEPSLYGKYLRATQLAGGSTAERYEALQLVHEVLEQAPAYGPALYLELALRSMTASFARPGERPPTPEELRQRERQRLDETRRLGERLLEVNQDDWRAHTLLLNSAFEERQLDLALQHAERLVQGPAGRPGGARIYAQLLLYTGYVTRARTQARLAAIADPLDAQAYRLLAQVHGMAGDDDAMRQFDAIAKEISGHGVPLSEAMLAMRAGDHPSFVEHYSQFLTPLYGDAVAARTVAQAVIDPTRVAEAKQVLDTLPPAAALRTAQHFMEYALLGLPARSADAVLTASGQSVGGWLQHLWWPELAPMRTEPAFTDAVIRLGLVSLWEREGAPDQCHYSQTGGSWRCP